eukprot:jgi/Hompol1/1869/HPOL_005762-RA
MSDISHIEQNTAVTNARTALSEFVTGLNLNSQQSVELKQARDWIDGRFESDSTRVFVQDIVAHVARQPSLGDLSGRYILKLLELLREFYKARVDSEHAASGIPMTVIASGFKLDYNDPFRLVPCFIKHLQ